MISQSKKTNPTCRGVASGEAGFKAYPERAELRRAESSGIAPAKTQTLPLLTIALKSASNFLSDFFEARLEEFDRLVVSQAEIKSMIADAMEFISSLEFTLREGLAQEKLVALRRRSRTETADKEYFAALCNHGRRFIAGERFDPTTTPYQPFGS